MHEVGHPGHRDTVHPSSQNEDVAVVAHLTNHTAAHTTAVSDLTTSLNHIQE